jgi:hypothetical protein
MLSGENINNSFKESSTRGKDYGSKTYLQHRKSRVRKGQKAVQLDSSEEYRPWETHVADHGDYEASLFHP